MPVTITQQPTANQLLSAYQPVVIACTATTADGGVPVLVLCDVYINGVYYRTFFSSKADREGKYVFDIQDAIQEKLNYFIPPIDGKKIEITSETLGDVFVRLRTTKLNSSGLNEPEQIAPIPGTEETPLIPGEGLQSNKFFALNLLIQNEENQNIDALLKAYRTNTWNNEALPLTRRNKTNFLTDSQSSFFPFLSEKRPKTICIDVRFKGQANFTHYCKELTNDDINEVSNPPVVNIKWKDNSGVENRNCSNNTCAFEITILKSDIDGDIASQEILVSTDNGVNWTSFSTAMINEFTDDISIVGSRWYKVIVTDTANNSGTSNVLKITKQQTVQPTTNYYYRAIHPDNHPSADIVTFLDQFSVEQTTELPRTAIAEDNPCTLIVASSIVSTNGAIACIPENGTAMTFYRAYRYGNSGDDITMYYFDQNGVEQEVTQYAGGGTMNVLLEVFACAITGSATCNGNGTIEEQGPCQG